MTYKGYEADIEFDEDARIFHGDVVNIAHDVIMFEGTSVDEIVKAFEESVEDYLELCSSRGEKPEEPISDALNIQVAPEIRRKLMLEAKRQGKTLEQYINEALKLRTMTGGGSS